MSDAHQALQAGDGARVEYVADHAVGLDLGGEASAGRRRDWSDEHTSRPKEGGDSGRAHLVEAATRRTAGDDTAGVLERARTAGTGQPSDEGEPPRGATLSGRGGATDLASVRQAAARANSRGVRAGSGGAHDPEEGSSGQPDGTHRCCSSDRPSASSVAAADVYAASMSFRSRPMIPHTAQAGRARRAASAGRSCCDGESSREHALVTEQLAA